MLSRYRTCLAGKTQARLLTGTHRPELTVLPPHNREQLSFGLSGQHVTCIQLGA